MISYIRSFLNFLFQKQIDDDNDEDLEDFLAENLLDLELTEKNRMNDESIPSAPEIPRDISCFHRTGIITYIDENHILIDGSLHFDVTNTSLNLYLNDKVLYLGYKNSNGSIVVVRILENQGLAWGNEETPEETNFKVIEHIIVGEVDFREERFVFMKQSDLKFSLDEVEGTLIPIKGDWLELKCTIQLDEEHPSDISATQVLTVISFKPLRSKVKPAFVTEWNGEYGTCDRQLYFDRQSLPVGTEPRIGSKVLVEAIESTQGKCAWRVIKLVPTEEMALEIVPSVNNDEESSIQIEKERNIEITHPLRFDKVDIHKISSMILKVTNKSNEPYDMNKWIFLSKKRDSQICMFPQLNQSRRLYPGQSFTFTIECHPKFLGNAKEHLIIMFRGFKIKRVIDINVINERITPNNNPANSTRKTDFDNHAVMKKVRNSENGFIPGERPVKPPNFIPIKLATFAIPERIWSIVLGDSQQIVHTVDYGKILAKIEETLPCLTQDLSINNYIDRWHYLLYLEEIQDSINLRVYDMPKAFLIRCQEYLSLEINGLSEKRPSLVVGDRVIVRDIWDSRAPPYEGYIHVVKGDFVLMKFSRSFHESYSGTDVSVEFHFNRSTYRRCHQAINLALSNLGPDILHPSRVSTRPPQLPPEKLYSIQWYNKHLNSGQKAAVSNILLGECRPKPYCIYGPPGTGKTVTVIETILQILTTFPDSRILVATPSNSAANLITQRLVGYKEMINNSFIRIIAHYLIDSDTIPVEIKPYCATLDIAREGTSKPKHEVQNGINVNCQKSFIGRHRVTIGTCYCLGTLAQVGLPKGHFTHVIVDEAGQATEPEIMIPLTFIDKENGQIVVAGDPMQLGPIVMSRYCKEFGMDESYLSRILETFPYQKDYAAFKNGFNDKLVTRLNDNYRSLQEVLTLPSQMFYDGTLVAKMERNQSWIEKLLSVTSEIFDSAESKTGGIYVYGIRGCNMRAEDSPSWYNPQEASMVALTTCKLFKKNVTADEIGVITPYIAQIKYLRMLFDAMGLPQPKIGTVEEFQGQERPLIIISTVRSAESLVQEDLRNALGFVQNPKRLNVAVTRAQVAVLLFCNPHLLGRDPLWSKIINQAVKEDKYMGCDLPTNVSFQNSNDVIQ